MNKSDKKRLDIAFNEAIQVIKLANDDDIASLLGDGIFQSLLEAIATPKKKKEQTIYEYLLEHKHRLQLLSLVRLAIQNNYAIKGKVGETNVFVSPWHIQWNEDGVMFLQGEKQFEGLIGLYQNGRVKFGIAKRMILGGDKIGPDDLEFVDVEEMGERSKQPSVPKSFSELENALVELETLLKKGDNDESSYQDYFINNPWVFGAKYKLIESHKSFNDENIPDFTGVRVRDSARDIIEIKPPFLPLFTQRNQFRSDFNAAWNQAERYLDFARQEFDYLKRQKSLIFENPKCYLLAGYNLSETQVKEIRRKERMNPAITILTYNDLFVMAQSTVNFFKSLKR